MLSTPVVCFGDPIQNSLWTVWAEQHAPELNSGPRPPGRIQMRQPALTAGPHRTAVQRSVPYHMGRLEHTSVCSYRAHAP